MDALVLQPHHLSHLAPVWLALDPSIRARLFVGFDQPTREAAVRYGIDAHQGLPPPSDVPVLVASGNELVAVKRAILLEHGAGQTYQGLTHAAWPGGEGRDNVMLFVVPNERVAAANRARYPHIPNAIVGSPHVEALRTLDPYPLPVPRVALSTHWEASQLVPELRSGWAFFERVYEKMCRDNPDAFVIHGHPRHADFCSWKAREWGVEYEPNFAQLTQRAWLYVTDNSSTLYEWAALNRPVVAVSPPWYRRDVEHGLRFWTHSDPGPQVFDPSDLESAILLAICDPPSAAKRRQEIVRELFGADLSRGASRRAADAIAEVMTVLES